jgi:hypothetical protein
MDRTLQCAPESAPDMPPAETELPINCEKSSKTVIRKAIAILWNGIDAGPDNIPTEAIKAGTEATVIICNLQQDKEYKITKLTMCKTQS